MSIPNHQASTLEVDNKYCPAHHSIEAMDTAYADGIPNEFILGQDSFKTIYSQDGITITAFDVAHVPIEPAVGCKIENMGKKLVISGDTKKSELLAEMAQDADLLVHEAMPMNFQQMLSKANVKKVVLNHLAPIPTNRVLKKMYLDQMAPYGGEFHLADDGDVFVVK